MSVVVLDQALGPNIPDLHRSVSGASSNARSIRVELHRVNPRNVVVQATDQLLRSDIPKFHGTVFRARGYQSGIRAEFSRVYPVIVCVDVEHKFTVCKLETL